MSQYADGPAPLLPLIGSTVYGPVRSRRLGWSLGVNLLPAETKVCTFNCVYCQYGWTMAGSVPRAAWPSPTQISTALERALASPDTAGRIDRITLAGHGEPTMHPDLAAIVAAIREVRRCRAPQAKVSILSNGTRAHLPEVRVALDQLDECYVKLDAGDQDTMRRVNASAFPIATLIATLRSLRVVVLQSMFVEDPKGRAGNTSPACVQSWLDTVLGIPTGRRPPLHPGPRARPHPAAARGACTARGSGGHAEGQRDSGARLLRRPRPRRHSGERLLQPGARAALVDQVIAEAFERTDRDDGLGEQDQSSATAGQAGEFEGIEELPQDVLRAETHIRLERQLVDADFVVDPFERGEPDHP